MKDYSKQILAILRSKSGTGHSTSGENSVNPWESDLSWVVSKLNLMIQEEVKRMEAEIVNLTEQLSESDSLMSELQRKSIRWDANPGPRHMIKTSHHVRKMH